MPEFDAVVPRKIIETSVNFGPDAELAFSFDANKVTPLWFNSQQRRLEEQDVLTVSRALAEIIESWNLTVAGQPTTPDVETLSRFPVNHLMLMMEAIAEIPTRAEGEVSSARSPEPSQTSSLPQPTPLNGQATSGSLTPSESLSPT
jgi:hypothetical protein